MSERLPYEDQLQQHWNDLPLPDENKAWEDMKRLLEEDDDDRPIIAWWRKGCLLWGFLLLVIFGSGLWLIRERYFSSGNNKKEAVTKQEIIIGNKKNDSLIIIEVPSNGEPAGSQQSMKEETGPLKELVNGSGTDNTGNPIINKESGNDVTVFRIDREEKNNELKQGKGIENPVVTGRRERSKTVVKKENAVSTPVVTGRRRTVKNPTRKQISVQGKPSDDKGPPDSLFIQPDQVYLNEVPYKPGARSFTGKSDSITSEAPVKNDSLVSRAPIKKDSLATNTAKKDSVKKKTPITFSAGIAMQQLLPVAGQKAVPYNSQGRKGTLADYIPSVYFRVIKEKKWFVQTEFKYGAPQLTKEFVYAQREDTAGLQGFAIRQNNSVKKTYYHQLPVTFNYFVTKDWSVGAGFTWNKFVKAIVENEVIRHNITTSRDSLIGKNIFSSRDDSASSFSKSYFQGVIESQYKWKRFSFGARYSFGLQPYIKFTLLNGEQKQESNTSLHIFLRYELWQSKKKK